MVFLNSEPVNNRLISDIFDVDEFILKVVNILPKDDFKYYEVRDFIKRHSFVRYKDFKFIGNRRSNQIEITTKKISNEDYIQHRGIKLIDSDGNGFEYCSILNYDDFGEAPLLNFIETIYNETDNVEPFFNKVTQWIDQTNGETLKELRLNELIGKINNSNTVLKNLKKGWGEIVCVPTNNIQKKVIEIHKNFNVALLEQINTKYSKYFSTLTKTLKPNYEIGFKLNSGYGGRTNLLNIISQLIE